MKKIFITICVLWVSMAAANAQAASNGIEVNDIKLLRTGDNVTVTFSLNAGKKAAKSGHSLIVNPVIRKNESERQLSPVVVQGRRAGISALRHELADGGMNYQQDPVYVETGGSVNYSTTIPYESWMSGAQLVFEGVTVGCCTSMHVDLGPVAENILYAEPLIDMQIVETPEVTKTVTTGEQLAGQYPFVAPVSDLDIMRNIPDGLFDCDMPRDNTDIGFTGDKQNEIETFINSTRKGSISIYFGQGKRDIDRNYSTNNRNLVELISAVRAIEASGDSRIVRIVIAGFASPDGTLSVNDRLAWDRAMALKSFLTSNSSVDPQVVHIYNGSVDWLGLRDLVAGSDMYRKHQVIDIIDNIPVWDPRRNIGRNGELMRLDGGAPYRYMLREFFPKLRQAAYIKVYFENK